MTLGRALALAALTPSAAMTVFAAGVVPPQAKPALPEVLTKSIAHYAALTSYADTGTMVEDGGGVGREARFTTFFRRATRDLYFDWQPVWSRSGQVKFDDTPKRTVLWMLKGHMERYIGERRLHEVVTAQNGGQVGALRQITYETRGTSILIPSLLYAQAGLAGSLREIHEAEDAGIEVVNGRRCHKITGMAATYYPSGARTNVRPVAVWIDTETLLVRRVFEDTPEGYGGGKAILKITTNLDPRANVALEDTKFQFAVPTAPAAK